MYVNIAIKSSYQNFPNLISQGNIVMKKLKDLTDKHQTLDYTETTHTSIVSCSTFSRKEES